MELLFKALLILHIIGGTIGLLSGLLNLILKKGDKRHKAIGTIFFYALMTAGFSSLVLSVMHPNHFMFIVGVFTLYMVSTGRRYIYLKIIGTEEKAKLFDFIITYTMMITGILFIALGILNLVKSNTFGIVFIVFGIISLGFVRADLKNYKGKSVIKNYWLTAHLQRMTGGFIAALTAFLVVNAKYFPHQIPLVLYWLLPTFILVPFIVKWSRRYGLKK